MRKRRKHYPLEVTQDIDLTVCDRDQHFNFSLHTSQSQNSVKCSGIETLAASPFVGFCCPSHGPRQPTATSTFQPSRGGKRIKEDIPTPLGAKPESCPLPLIPLARKITRLLIITRDTEICSFYFGQPHVSLKILLIWRKGRLDTEETIRCHC